MESSLTYKYRIKSLAKTKKKYSEIYRKLHSGERSPDTGMGAMDLDERGVIPTPADFKFNIKPNHESGLFFGPKACTENFARLLEALPVYIDPMSSLSGGYMKTLYHMDNLEGGIGLVWNYDDDYSHLYEDQKKYGIFHGIGAPQHFYQDIEIGFKLGWQGVLDKIRYYHLENDDSKKEFYDALENVVLGIQDFIRRHAKAAKDMADTEDRPELKENLIKMAEINEKLATEPPKTFYEAVQWFGWYIIVSKTYNHSGSGGAIDRFLKPYYEKDKKDGILSDEEAMFHLACLLEKEISQYYQIGGTDQYGNDITNPISFLVLDAARELRLPSDICIRVHDKQDPRLLETAVKYMFEDRIPYFNFLGDNSINEGFIKSGYPIEVARQREKSGCHWLALPGIEYTLNDVIKVNLAAVLNVALREMVNESKTLTTTELWKRFEKHLIKAVSVMAEGIDIHLEHMHKVFPELVIDLLCHGTIEKGLDASNGGVEFYNIGVDAAALATVADSFAALEIKIEKENKITWEELINYLDTDFKDAEEIRLMLKNIPRYGTVGTIADEYAIRISKVFTRIVNEKPTPDGFNMIPGIFSWANTVSFGFDTGATPNGRFSGQPISHGANPDPGFEGSDAITALATAVASVQCGYGNPAPLQIDIDPLIGNDEKKVQKFVSFILGYCDIGGTLLNVNILDKDKILEAYKDPSKFPDLIVRVTGFCAYFASLSKEWQKVVVERIIEGF